MLPDTISRCRHCFQALESKSELCPRCVRSPLLRAKRAFLFEPTHVAFQLKSLIMKDEALYPTIASLLTVLYHRLDWPSFDRVAVIPQKKNQAIESIGREWADLFDRKLSDELTLKWGAPFDWQLERKNEDLLEGQMILLIDFDSPLSVLRHALQALWPAFPKQIFILSIFENSFEKKSF